DDWEDLNPDDLIKLISENTEKANTDRRAAGISPLHVDGWREMPYLDRPNATVHWAMTMHDDAGQETVNTIAVMLGRDGFEKFIWAGTPTVDQSLLKTAQTSFSFPSGERYSDYREGDKVAEYGIAGLVAGILGTKIATKLGLFALLVVSAKKFGALI